MLVVQASSLRTLPAFGEFRRCGDVTARTGSAADPLDYNRFMVCFGRSLVLPRLFPRVSHSFWDRGLGPLMGSMACGLAIFIEERRKRAEMALYVAPRALYAVAEMAKPGWLSQGERGAVWAERFVFGVTVGIVLTAARFRPDFLRGVTSLMAWVAKSNSNHTRSKQVATA